MDKFFNPNVTYDNAIKNKEIGVLRALLTGIIGSDPTFATTEFDEAKKYIDKQSIEIHGEKLEITTPYEKQEDEVEVDKAEWDEKYFQMKLVWLRDNFNLDIRLPKIKEIGQVVYKNKITLGKVKVENRRQAVAEPSLKKENKSTQKKEQTIRATGGGRSNNSRLINKIIEWIKEHWVGVAIGVILVIVVISLVIKWAGKN